MDATALRRATTPGTALSGMLADGVAVQKGATCEGALPHVLQLAGTMPGFPLHSGGDGRNRNKAIGALPY